MSNGYILAAASDVAAARELADGFGLDLIDVSAGGDGPALLEALLGAANVGIVLSQASAQDEMFVSLVEVLAERLPRAQLIVTDSETRAAFPFLPEAWPVMALTDASARAQAMAAQRAPVAPAPEPPPAPPEPEALAPPPPLERQQEPAPAPQPEPEFEQAHDETVGNERAITLEEPKLDDVLEEVSGGETEPPGDSFGSDAPSAPQAPAERPAQIEPPEAPPPLIAPQAPAGMQTRSAPDLPRKRAEAPRSAAAASAPADATAFAPKKLRRGEAELVRIAIHQPKDLQAVIKAARKADPRTSSAPQSMGIGEVALGASVGVALEVKGAACDGAIQRRTWAGEPLEFSFAATADADVKQVVILARVFIDDAQIGVLAFTRGVTGPRPKALPDGDRVRLKRHKRVFLSYSSKDRETVSAIATAYQMAGVEHFWDRTSLKSGEEWHPRLRREIDRCDLFHLCWSKSAAASEWVEKEATHALSRKRRAKKPEITVQMLDGPPWAKHPDSLDSINFDDFVRAAIVGYARGEE
jgi:hypothetical protein